MTDMTAFERQVADEMLRRAGPVRPVDDLAVFDAVVATTGSPRWRLWTTPMPPAKGDPAMITGRTHAMFTPFKAIVAGALTFALLGVLSIAQPFDQQGATVPGAPVASPSPSAPVAPEASTTIGFSSFYTGIDFFGDIERGAQEAASTAGVEFIALNAYGDPAMQADQLEDFIADGVDAIIIAPVDPAAIVPSVEAANAAGIPVLAVDRTASGGMITSLIASDNVAAARMAAEALFDLMGGSGKVMEIQGDMAVSMGMDRSEGFGQALEAAPGITLAVQAPADFSYRLASQATRDALEQDPDITGVFAANLDMLQGAAQAVASAGKTDQVRIVGFDTSPTVLTAISDGSIDATVAQQPLLIGQQAVEAALAAVAGEPVEPFIPVETILVTADNVDQFLTGE